MKTNLLKTALCGLIAFVSITSWAGKEAGDSEIIVVDKDGRYRLASNYLDFNSFGQFKISEDLIDYISKLRIQGQRFAQLTPYEPYVDKLRAIVSPIKEYRLVPAEDLTCDEYNDVNLPIGITYHKVACTNGLITKINKDLIGKLSILDLALLILHEGIHMTSNVDHVVISEYLKALELIELKIIPNHNKSLRLTKEERYLLEVLPLRTAQIEERKAFNSNITVDESGVVLLNGAKYEIQDQEGKEVSLIGPGTVLVGKRDHTFVLKNSKITGLSKLELAPLVVKLSPIHTIKDSKIHASTVKYGSRNESLEHFRQSLGLKNRSKMSDYIDEKLNTNSAYERMFNLETNPWISNSIINDSKLTLLISNNSESVKCIDISISDHLPGIILENSKCSNSAIDNVWLISSSVIKSVIENSASYAARMVLYKTKAEDSNVRMGGSYIMHSNFTSKCNIENNEFHPVLVYANQCDRSEINYELINMKQRAVISNVSAIRSKLNYAITLATNPTELLKTNDFQYMLEQFGKIEVVDSEIAKSIFDRSTKELITSNYKFENVKIKSPQVITSKKDFTLSNINIRTNEGLHLKVDFNRFKKPLFDGSNKEYCFDVGFFGNSYSIKSERQFSNRNLCK